MQEEEVDTASISEDVPSNELRDRLVVSVLRGPNVGELFALDGDELMIGRSAEADVMLGDHGLSRRHAAIRRRGSRLFVEDLGSTNGTFIDGIPIERPIEIDDGLRIELGLHTILRFGLHDALEHAAARRTHEMITRDPLTGLFNRRHFEERLHSEVAFANRHNAPLGVLLIDADRFKRINDERGHAAGDAVLVALSGALQGMTRAEDVLARYGGEEFVIIARGNSAGGILAFAERIRAGVAGLTVAVGGPALRLTVSIGVAYAQAPQELEASDVLAAADRALYAAKEDGRDRVMLGDLDAIRERRRSRTVARKGNEAEPTTVLGRIADPSA
jgi:diguanylate cyclase (GGDEF)-like protein